MKNRNLSRTYIAQFYKNNKSMFILAALATVLLGMVNIALSGLMKELIDTISGAENALSLKILSIFTALLLASIGAVQLLDYHTRPKFLKRAMVQYKNYVFAKLSEKSIASFRDEATAAYKYIGLLEA